METPPIKLSCDNGNLVSTFPCKFYKGNQEFLWDRCKRLHLAVLHLFLNSLGTNRPNRPNLRPDAYISILDIIMILHYFILQGDRS